MNIYEILDKGFIHEYFYIQEVERFNDLIEKQKTIDTNWKFGFQQHFDIKIKEKINTRDVLQKTLGSLLTKDEILTDTINKYNNEISMLQDLMKLILQNKYIGVQKIKDDYRLAKQKNARNQKNLEKLQALVNEIRKG